MGADHYFFREVWRYIVKCITVVPIFFVCFFQVAFSSYFADLTSDFELDVKSAEVFRAVHNGNVSKLKDLLKDELFVDRAKLADLRDERGYSLLHAALGAKDNKREVVKFLLNIDFPANTHNSNKNTPLEVLLATFLRIVSKSRPDYDDIVNLVADLVDMLCAKGAKIGKKLVFFILKKGHVAFLKSFLENSSFRTNIVNKNKRTLLHEVMLCRRNQLEMAKLLIKGGLPPDSLDIIDRTPMEILLSETRDVDFCDDFLQIVEMLLAIDGYSANEVNLSAFSRDDKTNYYKELMFKAIEDAQKHATDKNYTLSGLVYNNKYISLDDVKRLIKEYPKQKYSSLLIFAVMRGRDDICTYLLDNKKKFISEKCLGLALERAVYAKNFNFAKQLYFGLNLDVRQFAMLIDLAVNRGHEEMVNFFLKEAAVFFVAELNYLFSICIKQKGDYIVNMLIKLYEFIEKEFKLVKCTDKIALAKKGGIAVDSDMLHNFSPVYTFYQDDIRHKLLAASVKKKGCPDILDIILFAKTKKMRLVYLVGQLDKWYYSAVYLDRPKLVVRLLYWYRCLDDLLKLRCSLCDRRVKKGIELSDEKKECANINALLKEYSNEKNKDNFFDLSHKKKFLPIRPIAQYEFNDYLEDRGCMDVATLCISRYIGAFKDVLDSGLMAACDEGHVALAQKFFDLYLSLDQSLGLQSALIDDKLLQLYKFTVDKGNQKSAKVISDLSKNKNGVRKVLGSSILNYIFYKKTVLSIALTKFGV